MQWHSAGEFFAMGGYAFYVWGSFGLCAVAMIVEPWLLRRRRRQVEHSLHRRRAAEGAPAPAHWSANRLEGTR
ncbi:MAG: heme exporter protein CcmD [Caldimonas sp.]